MSESSAEVRLQVVHPVPAFFVFQKIFLKLYSKSENLVSVTLLQSQRQERPHFTMWTKKHW